MSIRFCTLNTGILQLKEYVDLKEENFVIKYNKQVVVVVNEDETFYGVVSHKKINDTYEVSHLCAKIGKEIFLNASDIFYENPALEFLPVIDENGRLICFCYQDYDIEKMRENCLELLTSNKILSFDKTISHGAPIKIWGVSEIAYYFHLLLKKQNIQHYVYGDLWEYLAPEFLEKEDEVTEVCLNFLAEGNYGMSILEGAYGKTVLEWQDDDFKILYDFYRLNCIYHNVIDRTCLQQKLKKDLITSRAFMLARIGNTEISILKEYLAKKEGLIRHYSPFWMDYLYNCCGFFSDEDNSWIEKDVDAYAKLTLEALQECDYQVCWGDDNLAAGLNFLLDEYERKYSCRVSWMDLDTAGCCYDYITQKNYLEGKTVLVISPFTETMYSQYKKREQIFPLEFRMPECNLVFVRAPQTVMGNTDGFCNWFESYRMLCEQISQIKFDVALIGAGAYGFPLAAEIKRMGKQAFSLSSYLPNWFGIKMKRYCAYSPINKYWNDKWCFPIETPPEGYEKIELGCYWR